MSPKPSKRSRARTGKGSALHESRQPYKVAVWATGGVGKYAIRTIADRPNLELVGVWVHSNNKNGKDAGELAGIDPIGVAATQDASEILDGDADCVVYAAPAPNRMKEAIGDLCRILAAGKNIVTTAIPGLVYPRGAMPGKVDRHDPRRSRGRTELVVLLGHRAGFRCRPVPDSADVDVAQGVFGARHRDHELFRVRQPNTTCVSCSASASRSITKAG